MGRPNTASPSSAARPQDSDKSRNASFRLAVHLSILRLHRVPSVHEFTLGVIPPTHNHPSAKLRAVSHTYETRISASLPHRTFQESTDYRKLVSARQQKKRERLFPPHDAPQHPLPPQVLMSTQQARLEGHSTSAQPTPSRDSSCSTQQARISAPPNAPCEHPWLKIGQHGPTGDTKQQRAKGAIAN